jgi:hypothetical protein
MTDPEHYWCVKRHTARENSNSPIPQSSCAVIHLPENNVHTSHLHSVLRYSAPYIPSSTPELKQLLRMSPNALCSQPSKMTAAPGPELANPASFPRILATLSQHLANFPSQLLASYTTTFTSWSSVILGRITMTQYNGMLHTLPEAFPIPDITAETVSCTLLSDWISCFGRPQTIATDQESKFESQLFHNLAKVCGIHLCWTNPTILPPIASLIGYITCLKLPLCAMRMSNGLRLSR